MSSLRSLLCCCCEGSSTADDSPFERAVGLSRQPHSRSGALTVSGLRVSGNGQILADQAVLQDRAYWELVVEDPGREISYGVASPSHAMGAPLQSNGGAWVLRSIEMTSPLQRGDVLGAALDQADYPVRLRFFHNGSLAADMRGPVTEATPIIELTGAAGVSVTFGQLPFRYQPPNFEGLIKSQSLI